MVVINNLSLSTSRPTFTRRNKFVPTTSLCINSPQLRSEARSVELAEVPSENYFPADSNHVDSKVEKIIKINQETRRSIRPNRDCLLNRLLSCWFMDSSWAFRVGFGSLMVSRILGTLPPSVENPSKALIHQRSVRERIAADSIT